MIIKIIKPGKLDLEHFSDLHNGSLSTWGGDIVGVKVTDAIKLSNGKELFRVSHQPLLFNTGQGRTLGRDLVYPLLPGSVIEII